MLPIPSSAYGRFASILDLPGSESLRSIQSDIVATQELSRMMQDQLVKRTLYTLDTSPAASASTDLQWADASDWTEVQVDGVVQTADQFLPQLTDERIVTMASVQVTGTIASWTRGEILRHMPTTSAPLTTIAEFGAPATGLAGAPMAAPLLLPQFLVPVEATVRIREVVSADLALMGWALHMISAPPGVLSPFFGV